MAGAKSAGYKLATYKSSDGPRAGIIVGNDVFDAAKLTGKAGYATVMGIMADWKAAEPALKKAAARAAKSKAKRQPLAKTKLLAPLRFPSAIYCAGANYADHAAEMAAKEGNPPPPDPHTLGHKAWHFLKASGAITDPGATVKISNYAKNMDWEIELAAVIGKTGKDIPQGKALSYVAGYTIANDLSARDFTKRPHVADTSPFKYDWLGQKNFDGACPLGPWIVPADTIADSQNVAIKLSVNDVIKQDSHTSKMIFTLAEQIAHLSTLITLQPGDLILTGTPAGVGLARKEFLRPGDVVKVWIEGIGTLTNTCA